MLGKDLEVRFVHGEQYANLTLGKNKIVKKRGTEIITVSLFNTVAFGLCHKISTNITVLRNGDYFEFLGKYYNI